MLFNAKIKKENASLLAKNKALEEEISALKKQLEQKTQANKNQAEKIAELTEKNGQLAKKAQMVLDAEFNAKDYCDELTQNALKAYNLHLQALKTFITRWQASLPEAKQSPDLKKKLALSNALEEIIRGNTPVTDIEQGAQLIERLNGVIGGKNVYESDGFDLDAVLNPTEELDLEALCKELGVMD